LSKVSVFIFAAAEADQKRLAAAISQAVPSGQMEVLQSLQSLGDRLSKPSRKNDVAVVFAASRQELKSILTLEYLLAKVRTILILPDAEAETVALGHCLGARYLGYADNDLSDLAAVLEKMVKEKKTAKKKLKKVGANA